MHEVPSLPTLDPKILQQNLKLIKRHRLGENILININYFTYTLYMHIYVYVCTQVYVYIPLYTYACRGQRTTSGILVQAPLTLVFETGSLAGARGFA